MTKEWHKKTMALISVNQAVLYRTLRRYYYYFFLTLGKNNLEGVLLLLLFLKSFLTLVKTREERN